MDDEAQQTNAPEQPIVPDEPPSMEMDLTTPEELPAVETPPAEPEAPPEPPELAEPGVYLCVAEIAGEHAILGVLTEGQEYDYSQVSDPRTLQAVAAYVELGVLEKM